MSFKRIFSRFFSNSLIDGQSVFLFWDSTIYYPTWLNNGNEKYVWPFVQKSTCNEEEKRFDLFLKNGDCFVFLEKDIFKSYSGGNFKNIELYYNKNIVCSFDVTIEDVAADYILYRTEFVKDGGWQEVIKEFLLWKKKNDLQIEKNY